jgi:hypothetical protein
MHLLLLLLVLSLLAWLLEATMGLALLLLV